MPSQLQKIKSLIPYLPSKDANLANKFIEKHDYESLKDLTWSFYSVVENSIEKEDNKYSNINLDKIRELAVLADEYYSLVYQEEIEEARNEPYDEFIDYD